MLQEFNIYTTQLKKQTKRFAFFGLKSKSTVFISKNRGIEGEGIQPLPREGCERKSFCPDTERSRSATKDCSGSARRRFDY